MKIFLIYHSHIDIGYTERQERIASYQADFIRQAVRLVLSDKQNGRSAREKFKFSAEGYWAIEQYLEKYKDEGVEQLIQAVKTGNFELTGCYCHLTELLDAYNLGHSLDYARQFADRAGLARPQVAMAADINGFSYGFADCLIERDIRYLSTNINVHHGGAPFGKPFVPFYWKGSRGGRVLVYSGLPYHKANLLGLIPSNRGGIGEAARQRVFELADLFKKDGYDFIPVMGSGLYTDNSPISDNHCELIAAWNDRYGDEIEIVTATQKEFFAHLEAHQADIPEYAGDWSDWWSDGVISMPTPLRLFRNAQRTQKLIGLLDPGKKIVSEAAHEAISKNLILYAEHTYGHSASLACPSDLPVQQLEYRKIKYAVDADIAASSQLDNLTRVLGEAEFTADMPFHYQAVNPHDQPVAAAVCLPIDYWEEELFKDGGFAVTDETGKCYAHQMAPALRGKAICCAVRLAPHEHKKLFIKFGVSGRSADGSSFSAAENTFENDYFVLRYDSQGVVSILSKRNGEELLDGAGHRLGQPVYQVFAENARAAAAGPNYTPRIRPESKIFAGTPAGIVPVQTGRVFTLLRADYELPGVKKYSVYFKLFNALPRIELSVRYIKEPILEAEGLYTAFPLCIPGGEWHLSKAGTFLRADIQLPNVCHDYFTVGKGTALTNGREAVTVNTLDTPLIMLGELKLWHYSSETSRSGCLYSWLLNNKWETNFKAECSGCHESRYVVELVSDINRPEDCEEYLAKNDVEPVVLRGGQA